MRGQTEVELISSVCNKGCNCCISSFSSRIVAVGVKDVIRNEATSVKWQLPGKARPTLSFITPRILHSTTATTMQTNAKSAQQSAVKIYNAVYSSVQVGSSLKFLPTHRNLTARQSPAGLRMYGKRYRSYAQACGFLCKCDPNP